MGEGSEGRYFYYVYVTSKLMTFLLFLNYKDNLIKLSKSVNWVVNDFYDLK